MTAGTGAPNVGGRRSKLRQAALLASALQRQRDVETRRAREAGARLVLLIGALVLAVGLIAWLVVWIA